MWFRSNHELAGKYTYVHDVALWRHFQFCKQYESSWVRIWVRCDPTRAGFQTSIALPTLHNLSPGSKLLSFSWLYRTEQSLELRATRLEQGRRDIKPQIRLNNSSIPIENSHNILWSPADQLLIEIMPKQLEKTQQRPYRRSVPSPNTARRAVRSAYHRNIPHYKLVSNNPCLKRWKHKASLSRNKLCSISPPLPIPGTLKRKHWASLCGVEAPWPNYWRVLANNAETMGGLPAAIVGTTTKHLSHSNHVPTNYAPPINGK